MGGMDRDGVGVGNEGKGRMLFHCDEDMSPQQVSPFSLCTHVGFRSGSGSSSRYAFFSEDSQCQCGLVGGLVE